jgi:hypothetical protein
MLVKEKKNWKIKKWRTNKKRRKGRKKREKREKKFIWRPFPKTR